VWQAVRKYFATLRYRWADRAGLQPEKERAGLLLPQRPEDGTNQYRRPADIFLPNLNGVPAALDLVITAPQRQDIVALAGATSLAAATSYAATKKSHLNTAALCMQQGVHFMPVVAESTGAWEPEASKLLLQLSRSTAARTGDDAATLHSDLLQELSVVIRSQGTGMLLPAFFPRVKPDIYRISLDRFHSFACSVVIPWVFSFGIT
jgi:hypothetical protein